MSDGATFGGKNLDENKFHLNLALFIIGRSKNKYKCRNVEHRMRI